jgi:hypothetical protein
MAYSITTTAGERLASIADGTVNTTATSLTLIGKNYAGYGLFLNENYIKLLENFSNNIPPSSALTGQLWYDNGDSTLKVYNGSIWKPISSSATGSTQPINPVLGDLWWDTANSQLKVWSGSAWIVVGPVYTTSSGTSGALVETILDNFSNSHTIVRFYISNVTMAILSNDPTFTPQTAIAGFTTIKPGFNLVSASTIANSQYSGIAENALKLNGLDSSAFIRSDQEINTSYLITAGGGLLVGEDLLINGNVGNQSTDIKNVVSNHNMDFYVKSGASDRRAISIAGPTGNVSLFSNLSVTGGTITTTATTASLFNTGATTLNIGGAATSINLGGTSGQVVINANVGIGTATGIGTWGKVRIAGTGYQALNIASNDASGVNAALAANSNVDFRVNVLSNHPLLFFTNNLERVRVAANGDVEIGSSKFRFELSRLSSDYDAPTLRTRQQRGLLIKEFGFDNRPGGLWLYGQTNNNIGSQGAIGAGYVGDLGTMRALATSGSSIYFDQGAIRFFADTGYTVGTNVGLTERLRITPAGRVGIGTNSPDQFFHVRTTASGSTLNLRFGDVWGFGAGILNVNSSNEGSGVYLSGDEVGELGFLYSESGSTTLGTYGNVPLRFQTGGGERLRITGDGDVIVTGPGRLGYGAGTGGLVTQTTSRTTAVTINKTNGSIQMFSAAGSTAAATFVVLNNTVSATDVIILNQRSATNAYDFIVTSVNNGSFWITFRTTGGTTIDAPIINFAVLKANVS